MVNTLCFLAVPSRYPPALRHIDCIRLMASFAISHPLSSKRMNKKPPGCGYF